MEEETKEVQIEEEDLSAFDSESGREAEEEVPGDNETADDSENEEKKLESVAAELLEKHPEIAERLKAGEEPFTDGFFENLDAGMSPSAAYEHEELKSRLAAAEAEAERYKELYKTESRLRQNKERSSGSLKGENAGDALDDFELGFLED